MWPLAERLGIIVGAALACALLAAVTLRGLTPALALVPLAALPILIVTLGWSIGDGLAATTLATLVTSLLLGMTMGPLAAYSLALPALALGAVSRAPATIFHRVPTTGGPSAPGPSPGQLGMAAAAIVSIVALTTVALISFAQGGVKGAQAFMAGKVSTLLSLLPEGAVSIGDQAEMRAGIDGLVHDLPLSCAAFGTAFLLINLYLAARAVAFSGRLRRPWVDLPTGFRLPMWTIPVFAVALIAAILLPDGFDAPPWVIVGAMSCLYLFQGLATLHALTRGLLVRPFALIGLYFALLIQPTWIAPIVALLGLIESAVSVRTRFKTTPLPPPKAT